MTTTQRSQPTLLRKHIANCLAGVSQATLELYLTWVTSSTLITTSRRRDAQATRWMLIHVTPASSAKENSFLSRSLSRQSTSTSSFLLRTSPEITTHMVRLLLQPRLQPDTALMIG